MTGRQEIWHPIAGYEGLYEVSSMGRVRSLERTVVITRSGYADIDRTIPARILRINRIKGGNIQVGLSNGGRTRTLNVNVLVCTAFHGPRPSPAHKAQRRDGNSGNNAAGNLFWGTAADTETGKRTRQTHQRGGRHAHTDLTEAQVAEIFRVHWKATAGRRARAPVGTVVGLVDQFGTSINTVENIIYGRCWQHVTAPLARELAHA